MANILSKLSAFIAGLGVDQYAALLLMIVVGIAALKVAKRAVSIVLVVVGILAALYFIQPELFDTPHG